jgi:hypothetical protein
MKLLKKIICFFLIVASTMAFSAINEKKWIVLIKTYTDERFSLNFPKDPEYSYKQSKDNKKVFVATAAEAGVNYALEVAPNNNDEDPIRKMLDETKQNQNLEIIDYSTSSDRGSRYNKILDLVCLDHTKSQMEKKRIVVTKKNIYQLYTLFNSGEKNDHGYFINSFYIEPS